MKECESTVYADYYSASVPYYGQDNSDDKQISKRGM